VSDLALYRVCHPWDAGWNALVQLLDGRDVFDLTIGTNVLENFTVRSQEGVSNAIYLLLLDAETDVGSVVPDVPGVIINHCRRPTLHT
jgi:hypothetical protein